MSLSPYFASPFPLLCRLHGEFVVDYDEIKDGAQFVDCQIHAALQTIVRGCSPGLNSWYLSEQFEPDIRYACLSYCTYVLNGS